MSLYIDIEKDYGSFVLKSKLETKEGITCLLGASGSGKSLTLKCVAGIEKPDSGRIVLDDEVLFDSEKKINLPPQKRHVGYLFQNYALFPNMTVRQNIMCGLHDEKDKKKKEIALQEAIHLFQLEGLENRHPSQLSGGQAQRVALARILVNKPKLLMLDEPFSALDSHLREKLTLDMKLLLQNFGSEVLMVTHSRDEAYKMAEHIAVIDRGEVLLMKETKKLFADPGSIPAALITGCKNIAMVEKRGDHSVYVPDWGVTLETAKEVEDGIKAIGIRAHFFNPSCPQNVNPIRFCTELEEPFEWAVEFVFENQKESTEPVWWRLGKDKKPRQFPKEIGIAPSNIMLLY